jgi:phenylacetate-CoA ligase
MKTSFKRAIADDVDVAIATDLPVGKPDRPKLELVQPQSSAPRGKLEFWESERTRPEYTRAGDDSPEYFRTRGLDYLKTCMAHPYLPVSQIRQLQFERIYELVEMAYCDIPVYRGKYNAAGFSPSDLRTYDDIQKIPVITKPELIAAFPTRCVNSRFRSEDLSRRGRRALRDRRC